MGFSLPYGLLSLGFLLVLFWLYLRERRERPLEVPSLLAWRAVREETERIRFRPDLLFLLRVALLLLLGLAVARPYWSSPAAAVAAGRAVFVFDTSASMQTIEAGERRFDRARRKARDVLAALDPTEEVMLIAVDAHPRIVVAFTRDRSSIERAVEELEPGDGPTRLLLGIQLARASRGAGAIEIDVFTDVARTDLGVALSAGERLRTFRFGHTDDNVAIAALRVVQSPFQGPGEARAYAVVKNYAHAEKDVGLRVTLGAREILRQDFRLPPRESRAIPIRPLAEAGRLEARLEVADALRVDNHALAYVRPVRPIRLLLVTTSAEMGEDLRTLAKAVPAFALRQRSPSDVQPQDLAAADVAIFHGWVPQGPVASNALFVYPPAQNALFPVRGDVVGAQILDWDESDAILRDVRYVEALPLEHARMIRLPPWAHLLIESRARTEESRASDEEFPLAFAGTLGNRRVVCFAFDLIGRSLVKSENLSLLVLALNSLRWLTPLDPALPVQVDVGDTYRETLARPQRILVSSPDGSTEERPEVAEVVLDVSRSGETKLSFGGERRTIYGNLFDPEESDVGRPGPATEEVVDEGTAPARTTTARLIHELGRPLYRFAVALLFVEWLLAWWRRRRAHVE